MKVLQVMKLLKDMKETYCQHRLPQWALQGFSCWRAAPSSEGCLRRSHRGCCPSGCGRSHRTPCGGLQQTELAQTSPPGCYVTRHLIKQIDHRLLPSIFSVWCDMMSIALYFWTTVEVSLFVQNAFWRPEKCSVALAIKLVKLIVRLSG